MYFDSKICVDFSESSDWRIINLSEIGCPAGITSANKDHAQCRIYETILRDLFGDGFAQCFGLPLESKHSSIKTPPPTTISINDLTVKNVSSDPSNVDTTIVPVCSVMTVTQENASSISTAKPKSILKKSSASVVFDLPNIEEEDDFETISEHTTDEVEPKKFDSAIVKDSSMELFPRQADLAECRLRVLQLNRWLDNGSTLNGKIIIPIYTRYKTRRCYEYPRTILGVRIVQGTFPIL